MIKFANLGDKTVKCKIKYIGNSLAFPYALEIEGRDIQTFKDEYHAIDNLKRYAYLYLKMMFNANGNEEDMTITRH